MTSAATPPAIPRTLACARCGRHFDCGLGGSCWCADEPYRLPPSAMTAEDCLCPACLRAAAASLRAAGR